MYNNCSSGHVCDRLSHLIYRLHSSLDYKHKFILSTKVFNFKGEIESEVMNMINFIF